ncbi:MAG: hypothetical protein ABR566_09350 [Pyrinomonadaceae bacterium]
MIIKRLSPVFTGLNNLCRIFLALTHEALRRCPHSRAEIVISKIG